MAQGNRYPRLNPFHIIRAGIVYELSAEPEGGYTITVPVLPGCVSWGRTIDESLSKVTEAMHGWLQVAREEGIPIPDVVEASSRKAA